MEENRIFAFDDRQKELVLSCQIYSEAQPGLLIPMKINLDDLDQSMVIDKEDRGLMEDIYITTHTNGYTKILTISNKFQKAHEKQEDDHTPSTMNIDFPSVGISIVSYVMEESKGEE